MAGSSYNYKTGVYDSGFENSEVHKNEEGWELGRYFRPFKDIKKTLSMLTLFGLYHGNTHGRWDKDTDTAWMNFVNSDLSDLYGEDLAYKLKRETIDGVTYVHPFLGSPIETYYGTPSLQKSSLSTPSNTTNSSSSKVTYNIKTGKFTGGDLDGKSWTSVRLLVMGNSKGWSDTKFRKWCKNNNIAIKKYGGVLLPKYNFNYILK